MNRLWTDRIKIERMIEKGMHIYKRFFKRFYDLIFSLIMMPILLVIFIVIGLLIKASDGGPIFYNGMRLGKNSKIFKMYKFRSMKVNSLDLRNADGSTYNAKDDPRLTRVGKYIREIGIDEIPQLLNIIKGDESFIGPRPDLPDALNIYQKDERQRNEVRPGITGYSQAFFRNNQPLHERFQTDVFYANNISLLLDLKILFKTVGTVIFRRGIYRNTIEKLETSPQKGQCKTKEHSNR